mgnify:CR=1 FL=1
MGTILVVAEIQKGAIRDASYELVAAARGIEGAEVNGLVIGSGVGDLASEFASKGAGKTLVVDDPAAANYYLIGCEDNSYPCTDDGSAHADACDGNALTSNIINNSLVKHMINKNIIQHTNSNFSSVLFLEDYSYYIDALIGLYEVTFDQKFLNFADQLTLFTNEKFKESNGFYRFSTNQQTLFADSLIDLVDGVTPSANSIMNFNLFRLGHYYGNKEYLLQSKMMIDNIIDNLNERVTDHLLWLNNSHNYSQKFYELAISGKNATSKANELMEKYLPNALIAASTICSGVLKSG